MSFWRNRETSVSRHFCNHQNFPHNKKYGGRDIKNDKQEHWRLLNKAVIISEIFLIDHDGVISWSLMLQKMPFHCFRFPSKNPGQYLRGCEKSQWWQHEVHIQSLIMFAMKSEQWWLHKAIMVRMKRLATPTVWFTGMLLLVLSLKSM